MSLFIENAVSASSLSRLLNSSMKPQTFKDSIVFIRNPIDRFWSAVKKEYSDNDIKTGINLVLSKLDNTEFSHYLPQKTNISNQRVTKFILMNDTFTQNIIQATLDNGVKWIQHFNLEKVLEKPVNPTFSSKDNEAKLYIKNNNDIFNKIKDYYKDDFALWETLNA